MAKPGGGGVGKSEDAEEQDTLHTTDGPTSYLC